MLQYFLRRLLYIIPVLILISIIAFAVIQAPPGNFLNTYLANLRQMGTTEIDDSIITRLEDRYGLNQPVYVQYFKWISGFPRGDFGRSFEHQEPVINLIRSRLGFTVLIASLTIFFQLVVAIPIGVYSAVKQYSIFDYFWTFIGFIGLSVPNFLLALILMFIGVEYFNTNMGGLFSSEYIRASWSVAKVLDMLSHVWVPVVVIGTAGMAGQIRIMRGQMLDEIGKQYMQTARSKGLKELTIILKHGARVAINPIISTIGWMLPQVISGGTITGIVLSLPTLGPLLYSSLTSQDMFLAGTIVLFQSSLIVIGTLLSDVLLAVIDPRIRYE